MDKCLVCVRIPPKHIAMYAHKIFNKVIDKATVHKIIVDACNAVNYADKNRRIALCGKSEKSILSGLFFLLQYRYINHDMSNYLTQTDVAQAFPKRKMKDNRWGIDYMTEVALRSSIHFWRRNFPELVREEVCIYESTNVRYRSRSKYA